MIDENRLALYESEHAEVTREHTAEIATRLGKHRIVQPRIIFWVKGRVGSGEVDLLEFDPFIQKMLNESI